jgi:predicted small metal-binding protein
MRGRTKDSPTSLQRSGKAVEYITVRQRRNAMQKVINCPCGFVVKGSSDDEVVSRAQEHARQVHQMDLTREQALAMAKPA